ncbi:MAG: polysaccharide deacetylase [Firmicutes bacterium]|nr:polysaccharide deacetylase [Bacillota bacterium]
MRKASVVASIILLLMVLGGTLAYNHMKKENVLTPSGTENKYVRGHNIPGKLYWAGSAYDKEVALTFDDGPETQWTPQILDILKAKNVKATFFVIGRQAEKYPEMLRRMVAEGHSIGNHTFDHADLTKMSPQEAEYEIDRCIQAVSRNTGKKPRLVRPPFGFHNTEVDNMIYAKNGLVILWSLDTQDWMGMSEEKIKTQVLSSMKNGFIVLQHDGENPKLGGSVQALPAIIDGLKAQGYAFVTIDELLETQPYYETEQQ